MAGDPESELSPQLIFVTGSVVTWCGRTEWLFPAYIQRLVEEYPELQSREEFKTVETASDRRIAQWVRACRLVFGGHFELIEEIRAIAAKPRIYCVIAMCSFTGYGRSKARRVPSGPGYSIMRARTAAKLSMFDELYLLRRHD